MALQPTEELKQNLRKPVRGLSPTKNCFFVIGPEPIPVPEETQVSRLALKHPWSGPLFGAALRAVSGGGGRAPAVVSLLFMVHDAKAKAHKGGAACCMRVIWRHRPRVSAPLPAPNSSCVFRSGFGEITKMTPPSRATGQADLAGDHKKNHAPLLQSRSALGRCQFQCARWVIVMLIFITGKTERPQVNYVPFSFQAFFSNHIGENQS
jgi:hypothetical protein